MAKSIWKRGVKMTRKEKAELRSLMPHPNRGRALYQWKAESAKTTRAILESGNKEIIEAIFGGEGHKS